MYRVSLTERAFLQLSFALTFSVVRPDELISIETVGGSSRSYIGSGSRSHSRGRKIWNGEEKGRRKIEEG